MKQRCPLPITALFFGLFCVFTAFSRAELTAEQAQVPLEVLRGPPGAKKVVLIAGEPSNKPGQHEYFAGCALLGEWLGQVPGVSSIMVAGGWPRDEAIFDGASAVVFFMDGGEKLSFLNPERWAVVRRLAEAGVGFVVLHQGVDCPAAQAEEFKSWFGAVFEGEKGSRGHWDVRFNEFQNHEITQGFAPFELLKDGWLYGLTFAEKGVSPVLACEMPESSRKTAAAKANAGRPEVVAWSYERDKGMGRSFGFTGCDLHENWKEASQRLLVLNGILWTAHAGLLPLSSCPKVSEGDLRKNWDRKLVLKKPQKAAEKQKEPAKP